MKSGLQIVGRRPMGPGCHLQMLVGVLVVAACCSVQPAVAQPAQPEQSGAAENDETGKHVRPSLDLGSFQLRDMRAESNETAKVFFTLHLALPHSVEKKTVERLEAWRHRLRDQVIIAVRLTETKNFLQPDLRLLRRNVLLRVNRLLKVALVEEVLLTEFTFTTIE